MRDGNPGADEGTEAAVERREPGSGAIPAGRRVGCEQDRCDFVRAQPCAFHAEICQFVRRFAQAESRTELQAIDDGGRMQKTDMFGPQIAVGIEDMGGPLRHEPPVLGKEPVETIAAGGRRAPEFVRGEARDLGGAARDLSLYRERYSVGSMPIRGALAKKAASATAMESIAARSNRLSRIVTSSMQLAGRRRMRTSQSTGSPPPSSAKTPFASQVTVVTPR
jgi:hypothetical protein